MPKKKPPLQLVDTNVAIVANGNSEQASDDLQEKCIDALRAITKQGGLVMDDEGRIFEEYQHKLDFSGLPGMGDAFLKWVYDHQWNSDWCEMRSVTCQNEDEQVFDEFPSHPKLKNFDVSDRKFVAVANAGSPKAKILQAVDFKWWDWKGPLAEEGIDIVFIDEEVAEQGFQDHKKQQ